MFNADMMYRVPLLYKGRNDYVNTLQLLIRDSKALATFAAYILVFLLGILGIIEMSLILAAMPLRASIADIRRLQNSGAMPLYILYAGLITILATGAAVLAELFLAGLADIPVMLTGSAVHAGIVRIRFHDFDVSFDLFSDCGRILPDD